MHTHHSHRREATCHTLTILSSFLSLFSHTNTHTRCTYEATRQWTYFTTRTQRIFHLKIPLHPIAIINFQIELVQCSLLHRLFLACSLRFVGISVQAPNLRCARYPGSWIYWPNTWESFAGNIHSLDVIRMHFSQQLQLLGGFVCYSLHT